MTAQIAIRPLRLDERAAWEPLWKGYLDFYRMTAPQETYDTTWARLLDPNEPMWLLGGYIDGKLLGIVHYIYHRSCWTIGDYCYLQDLFVAEGARKLGVGRALIEAVYEAARAAGASRVHWLTHETNAVARSLYDTLADRPGFIQYRKIFRIFCKRADPSGGNRRVAHAIHRAEHVGRITARPGVRSPSPRSRRLRPTLRSRTLPTRRPR